MCELGDFFKRGGLTTTFLTAVGHAKQVVSRVQGSVGLQGFILLMRRVSLSAAVAKGYQERRVSRVFYAWRRLLVNLGWPCLLCGWERATGREE